MVTNNLLLKTLVLSPWWAGAVIVYFAAQPKLQLQYCGIVDAPLPGLAKRVQSAVDSWK